MSEQYQELTPLLSSALVFPVVAFAKDRSVNIAKDVAELTTCSHAALSGGYFDGLKVISVDGSHFVVKSAKKTGTIKHWWTSPIFLTLVSVDLELERVGTVTLEELKQMLLKAFKALRDIWEESIGYEEFAGEIEKCRTYREVADYVSKF